MNNYWKVILATVVIFGAGVITGGLLVKQSNKGRNWQPRSTQVQPPSTPGARPPQTTAGASRTEFLRRMQPQLNLTPEQRQEMDRLLAASQDRTRKLMEPVTPLVREEVARTKEAFREILNPRQQRIFDDLIRLQQRNQPPRRPPGSSPNPNPDPGREFQPAPSANP